MAINYVNQWAYENSNSASFQTSSGQPFWYVGKNNNTGTYYTYVVKLQTTTALINPTVKINCAGTDNTSSLKWLSAKFVPCTSSENPSSTYIGTAVEGDTRLRFGMIWNGSSWTSNGSSNPAEGRTTNVTIPKGYFFIYFTHHASSTNQHSYSTIRPWSGGTNLAPSLTGTEAYTITYSANGGSGSTASQIVAKNSSVSLNSNGFTAPTTAVHGITLYDSDDTLLTASSYSSFVNNAFYRWNINGSSYEAGAKYTPSGDVTASAMWSTNYTLKKKDKSPTPSDGFTITYDANGGSCEKTSEMMTNTTTYEHIKWVSGNSEFGPTATVGGAAAYTFKVKYSSSTSLGSTTLPTPTHKTTTNLTVNYDYQGGSGSPSSSNYTKTITKTFKGWNTSKTATTGSTGTYTPEADVTLYAIWGSDTITYSTLTLPSPTKIGYSFMGWATSATASSGPKGSYTPTFDISKLYAIWKPDGNVRIYANGTYKMALAYIYAPSSSSDTKPWKLTLVYLKNPSSSSDTKSWKLIAG